MSPLKSQRPLLPPVGLPKDFPGTRENLLRIAALCGLYLLCVVYPAFLWLTSTVPSASQVAIALLCAAGYVAYAFFEMKRLTLTSSKPDQVS